MGAPRLKAFVCALCGASASRRTGDVNRALRGGYRLYCGRECSAEAKRLHRSKEAKRVLKAEYDRKRRHDLADRIRAEKRAAYLRDRERHLAEQAAKRADPRYRLKMKAYQHDWIRRPAVKAAKKKYDRIRRAVMAFGDNDLAAAHVALCELSEMLRPAKAEITANKGRINLCSNRKRKNHAAR